MIFAASLRWEYFLICCSFVTCWCNRSPPDCSSLIEGVSSHTSTFCLNTFTKLHVLSKLCGSGSSTTRHHSSTTLQALNTTKAQHSSTTPSTTNLSGSSFTSKPTLSYITEVRERLGYALDSFLSYLSNVL